MATRFRNLSRADSVIGHLASFLLDSWKLLFDHISCKFEKDEFSRILVSGVCLLIFMKVIIYSYERWWDTVASKLFGQIDFEDYYIVLRWIRGILPSYWILILRID